MSFRTVVIKNRCKLEYSLNQLVYRSPEMEKRICLDEITTLIIQNTGVAITAALLSMLMEKKIKVIFCDAKSNPQGELVTYHSTYNSYEKIKKQVSWNQDTKQELWKAITIKKIEGQRNNLRTLKNDICVSKLNQYLNEIEPGDVTNREGHAAKVYFNGCFGSDFSRGENNDVNKYLNYGYSIILSAINREIKAFGYLTELGIHHVGVENPFNLSCDFMEPLRPYIDFIILNGSLNEDNFKTELINSLNAIVKFENNEMILDNAIHLYVQSLLTALNESDVSKVRFISYEFV